MQPPGGKRATFRQQTPLWSYHIRILTELQQPRSWMRWNYRRKAYWT